jgi:hypothetical protein
MIGRGSHIVGHFNIEIGDDVHTGPYVYITDQNHGYEAVDEVVHVQWPHDVPVRIGTGCWLGTGVVILPGTELGENVVVAAGAVVRGHFPDFCVIAGVPAKVVRHYTPDRGWVSGPLTEGTDPGADAGPGATDRTGQVAARAAVSSGADGGTEGTGTGRRGGDQDGTGAAAE